MHELLSDASRWIQGVDARDNLGNVVNPNYKTARCWCINGAVLKCYPGDYATMLCKIADATMPVGPMTWNDMPSRTFPEVRALLLKLDI